MTVRSWLMGLWLLGGCVTTDRWATTAVGVRSEPAVALLVEGGAAPRRPLRYSFREGSEQQATVAYEFHQYYWRGSWSSEQVLAYEATLVARTIKVGNDGVAECELDITSGELRETYSRPKQSSYDLKGVRALVTLGPLGEIEALRLFQPGANRWVSTVVELALTSPLPEQPVGPGARWKTQFVSYPHGAWLTTLVEATPSSLHEVSLPPPIEASARNDKAPRNQVCPSGCFHLPTAYEGQTKRWTDLSLPMPQELDWQTRQTYVAGEERWLLTGFHRVKSHVVH